MAPDLNSVPPSPRPISSSRVASIPSSRRTSQQMPPPVLPITSPALNILPSNQSTVINSAQPLVSPSHSSFPTTMMSGPGQHGDNTGVGTGPGPLRHPRPLTAVDLHLQLEKEQEAVVNRLTRELTILRSAQNASVASNSSSTFQGFIDASEHNTNHMLSGPNGPAPAQRQRHRSSSSTSNRSIPASGVAGSTVPGVVSSTVDRTRPNINRQDSMTQSLSRQNSIASSRRSGASSPVLVSSQPSSYHHSDYFPSAYNQRPSISQAREASMTRLASGSGIDADRHTSTSSLTSVPTTGRYEEAAYHRQELEIVKRENEALKRRIRELERTLRELRQTEVGRTRSESVSTTASVSVNNRNSIGGFPPANGSSGDRDKDGEEDRIHVRGSASSGG